MTAALFVGATLLFGLACLVYYRGLFLIASVVGIVFGLTLISISFRAMNPVVWSLMVTSLAAFPALLLILHAVDLRAGLCLLPTVYSIPFAFLSGALLWLFSGFALLWSASS